MKSSRSPIGPSDLRISNEKSQIGVATRLDAERDALRPSSLLGGMHLPSGYAAVKMRTLARWQIRFYRFYVAAKNRPFFLFLCVGHRFLLHSYTFHR